MLKRISNLGPTLGCLAAFALCVAAAPPTLSGYSVLSHEALIDAAWDPVIVPILAARFPHATKAQLQEARAYAYGGCVIQDMGYYPFGNRFFSNLTHYVRTGGFVEALLNDSRSPDEYAFALGALSHYVADNTGHPLAVNLSVPDMYPKLRRKYGKRVTYEDDPRAHIMVEFSF
ncbi:MAG: zinc dependent phospholipase C family protein, partial [Terriglobia bacterium]